MEGCWIQNGSVAKAFQLMKFHNNFHNYPIRLTTFGIRACSSEVGPVEFEFFLTGSPSLWFCFRWFKSKRAFEVKKRKRTKSGGKQSKLSPAY